MAVVQSHKADSVNCPGLSVYSRVRTRKHREGSCCGGLGLSYWRQYLMLFQLIWRYVKLWRAELGHGVIEWQKIWPIGDGDCFTTAIHSFALTGSSTPRAIVQSPPGSRHDRCPSFSSEDAGWVVFEVFQNVQEKSPAESCEDRGDAFFEPGQGDPHTVTLVHSIGTR